MIPALIGLAGSAISAGASFAGSSMSSAASAKAARLNAIAQAQENQLTREYNEQMLAKQWAREDVLRGQEEKLQREFAQSGIQWRVADARAAGIHPFAALGAQGATYSTSVGNSSFTPGVSTGASPFSGSSRGSGLAAAGQEIGRAVSAAATDYQRAELAQEAAAESKLRLSNLNMQNQLLASQIAKNLAVGPSMPSPARRRMVDGQGDSPSSTARVKWEPMETQHRSRSDVAAEPQDISDVGYARTGSKRAVPVMSDIAKDRLEEDKWGTFQWVLRNNLAPMVGLNMHPPSHIPLKSKDHAWYMNPFTGEYRQRRKDFIDRIPPLGDVLFPKTPWQSNWK